MPKFQFRWINSKEINRRKREEDKKKRRKSELEFYANLEKKKV